MTHHFQPLRTKEQKINVRDSGELSYDYLFSEDISDANRKELKGVWSVVVVCTADETATPWMAWWTSEIFWGITRQTNYLQWVVKQDKARQMAA